MGFLLLLFCFALFSLVNIKICKIFIRMTFLSQVRNFRGWPWILRSQMAKTFLIDGKLHCHLLSYSKGLITATCERIVLTDRKVLVVREGSRCPSQRLFLPQPQSCPTETPTPWPGSTQHQHRVRYQWIAWILRHPRS